MKAIIISVGDELTFGQIVDTNSAWLAQQLADIGIHVAMHLTVADEVAPLEREIRRACELADVVLISGGLGPTEDDLTRNALAAVLGTPLQLDPTMFEQVQAFFMQRNIPMPEANAVQAMFPAGSTPIENTCGTAPGIRATFGRAKIYIMPGVPREMRVMYERSVAPELQTRCSRCESNGSSSNQGGSGSQYSGERNSQHSSEQQRDDEEEHCVILARTLLTYGAGESQIGEQIRDFMRRGQNPTVGTTAHQAIISIRIHAAGVTRQEAANLLARSETEIRRRLGKLVFGQDEDTLWSVVTRLLIARGQTVSTAESCTGGLIAKCLTDTAGSSAAFIDGVVTYSNAAKTRLLGVPGELIVAHGAVSQPVAEAMAVRCRQLSNTDYAISVTGIAGPDGGSEIKPVGLVYIGLADAKGCDVRELRLGSFLTRDEIRERACKAAVNLLRLALINDAD